jgi:cellulose synthase operon protein C
MSFNKLTVGALLAAACVGGALACGPHFPWELLEDRDGTLSYPVALSFPYEVSRLLTAPSDSLRAVESYDPIVDWGRNPSEEPEVVVAEHQEARSGAWHILTDPAVNPDVLVSKLAAAREAGDGEAALSAGAGLPPAVLNYIAGAIEFRADRLETATRYFEAIDRLPQQQRQIRAVAAAYMQGRVQQRLGRMAPARAAFQAARRYAETGAPDPMGLAVASLGEEARTCLVEAGLVRVSWPVPASDADDAKLARLIADAVRLYADQAARGSKMALLSLREVAARLVARERELTVAVADPLVRRLLVAYALARSGDDLWDAGQTTEDIDRIIDALATRAAPAAGEDLDRLATLVYLGGRYNLAEWLVSETTRPLGLWVRAKLALRRGDRAAAARDWTAALKGAEQAGTAAALDEPAKTMLRGEVAVVRLSQGEYSESLRLLFPVASDYWGDVTYIAERVLTVDELKAFVDGLPPPSGPRTPESTDDYVFWGPDFVPADRLRLVLARRLIREGRVKEAVAYFPAAASDATPDKRNATAEEARSYLAAVEAARPGWPFDWPWQRAARAEALFRMATLERRRGMQLMGTEGVPDVAALDGDFSYGVGQSSPSGWRKSPSALLGPDEESRFAASAPRPDVRFHYRSIAADRASAAADLLPKRSQAYAATLCWAARFAIDSSNQAKADAIYRRYVANGAYQAWARDFGQICPAPDFEGARTHWVRRIADWVTRTAGSVWRHISLVAAMTVAAALLAAVVWRGRILRDRQG